MKLHTLVYPNNHQWINVSFFTIKYYLCKLLLLYLIADGISDVMVTKMWGGINIREKFLLHFIYFRLSVPSRTNLVFNVHIMFGKHNLLLQWVNSNKREHSYRGLLFSPNLPVSLSLIEIRLT